MQPMSASRAMISAGTAAVRLGEDPLNGDSTEIARRLQGEVFVTQVEVLVG